MSFSKIRQICFRIIRPPPQKKRQKKRGIEWNVNGTKVGVYMSAVGGTLGEGCIPSPYPYLCQLKKKILALSVTTPTRIDDFQKKVKTSINNRHYSNKPFCWQLQCWANCLLYVVYLYFNYYYYFACSFVVVFFFLKGLGGIFTIYVPVKEIIIECWQCFFTAALVRTIFTYKMC